MAFPNSLRGRLLVVLLALAALPSLLIGGLAYWHAVSTIRAHVRGQLTTIADLKKAELSRWLEDRVADARLLGENFLNEEHFTEILDPKVPLARRLAFAGFLTDNLHSLQQTRQGYGEILFVDRSERVILSTNATHIGMSLANDLAVAGTFASSSGQFIQDVRRRTTDGVFEMVFGHVLHAVDLSSNRVLPGVNGAVIIRVHMADTVYAFLNAWPGQGATSEAFIVRDDGTRVSFLSPLRFGYPTPLTLVLSAESPNAWLARRAVLRNDGIAAAADYRGIPVLAAHRTIPETGWGFVAKMDTAEAFASVTALTREVALATLLTLLAAGVAGVLLAGALVTPLARLARATQAVAAGDFHGKITVRGKDEVGSLAQSFRLMMDAIQQRNAALQRTAAELEQAYDTTLEGWSRALDLRDKETEGHSRRVTEMTLRLARYMGVPKDARVHMRRGALLHDIGKMGVPDAVLLKPGPLTNEEEAVMRRHPSHAYELLAPIAYLRPALDIPYCHHERWDGTGYPRGLHSNQIPLAARVFAVADVWDALRSDRPYRPGWTEARAAQYIREQAGRHFDPRVVEAFLQLIGEEADGARAPQPAAGSGRGST